jgi:hypothetical protein
VAVHADEDLLYEVLGALAVADRPIDEVQEPGLVAIDQRVKSARLTVQVLRHKSAIIKHPKIVQRTELDALGCGLQRGGPHRNLQQLGVRWPFPDCDESRGYATPMGFISR